MWGVDTIASLLHNGEDSAPALMAVDGGVLDWASLRRQVDRLAAQFRAAGIGADDRLAIVLPNGPEMALVFLAAAVVSCAAPLNPSYREDEFRFSWTTSRPKAIITRPDDMPAAHAALPPGTATIAVHGDFSSLELVVGELGPPLSDQPTDDNVALVLHTSGTTSRPKIVPLRQRHLVRSARNIAGSLGLNGDDRSLNVMPLFTFTDSWPASWHR